MQGLGRRALHILAAALAVVAACVASASAQGTAGGAVPSCAAKLVPCAAYLNATTAPPAACCGPLKEAAANETACLCAMLLNKAALQAFGVAPEQGLGLAKRCGVTTDASACAKTSAAATTSAAAGAGAATGSGTAASSASTGGSASTVTKPTANRGGATHHRLSLTGASALVGFSFIWCAIMA